MGLAGLCMWCLEGMRVGRHKKRIQPIHPGAGAGQWGNLQWAIYHCSRLLRYGLHAKLMHALTMGLAFYWLLTHESLCYFAFCVIRCAR